MGGSLVAPRRYRKDGGSAPPAGRVDGTKEPRNLSKIFRSTTFRCPTQRYRFVRPISPGRLPLHVVARGHSSKQSVALLLIEDDRRVILLSVRTGSGSRNCISLSVRENGALVRIDHLAILRQGDVESLDEIACDIYGTLAKAFESFPARLLLRRWHSAYRRCEILDE